MSSDPVIQILHTIANPIRKDIIGALTFGPKRFSQILAACSLNYDHDTGHFYYHLSELTNKGIVEKNCETYLLTEFGSKIAEMLNSLEKESSFLFKKISKGEKPKMMTQNLEMEWIEYGKEMQFKKRTEKGSMHAGFYTGADSLQKHIVEELPDSPERSKLVKFLEEFKSLKGATLLAKDKGTPLGWAELKCGVSWGDLSDKETQEPKLFAKTFISVENLAIMSWAKDRKGVTLSLLEELINKDQQVKTDAIQLLNINAEDSEVVEALKELGFERIAVNYSMNKTLTQ